VSRYRALAFLLLVLSGNSFSAALAAEEVAAQTSGLANSDTAYLQLRNIKIGAESVSVSNFTLKRDAGIFTFRSGVFSFLEPVNGKITGAVFTGDATFSLNPPIAVEQRNLAILTKGQPFSEEFNAAVFRFTDGSEVEIRKAASGATAAAGDAPGLLAEVQEQLRKTLRENLAARLLEDVLSTQTGGKFVAFIKGNKYSSKMIYDIDPHGVSTYDPDPPTQGPRLIRLQGKISWGPEEVALSTWDEKHYGIWAAFHFSREYASGIANSDEQNSPFSVPRQQLDVSIDKGGFLNATAQTTVTARQDGVRVLGLLLFPTLRVESVTGPDRQPIAFIQEDKQQDADFAVILPKALNKGENLALTIKYSGQDAVVSEGGGNYYPVAGSRDRWYPGLGFSEYSTYEMTFRLPKGLKLTATGKLLRSIDGGNETITEWRADVPQPAAGFNFGKLKREEGKPVKQPYVLETFANEEPPDYLKAISHSADEKVASGQFKVYGLGSIGLFNTTDMMKKAMGEAQLSVELFTEYFGEAPYKRLAMTEQAAWSSGQSWPGLIYLPVSYFLDDNTRHRLGMENARGYFRIVGPHEIAHQWWGGMVGFNSYRDQWISEGFAELSASLFLQAFYQEHGLDEYHKFWSDERYLLTLKNSIGKRAVDVGPLTLGYRLSTAKSGFDIARRLIYPKGGYVLQMVRFMLRNEQSPDPDRRFKDMMHEFTRTYANRPASTEDFKVILEKYMTPEMDVDRNRKMDWFFNEFVYGTAYPSYRFEHSFTTDASGDVVLNFKLAQSDVDKDFAMLIPVYIEIGNRQVRLGSALVVGNNTVEQHVPLKGLKDKPRRAMIAYFDDVLGNVENK
jgi:peptidase M1-like protein